ILRRSAATSWPSRRTCYVSFSGRTASAMTAIGRQAWPGVGLHREQGRHAQRTTQQAMVRVMHRIELQEHDGQEIVPIGATMVRNIRYIHDHCRDDLPVPYDG